MKTTTTAPLVQRRGPFLICLGSFLAVHFLSLLLPSLFETWNARIVDRLFTLRSASSHWRPTYDTRVAHVDLNNAAIQQMQSLYPNRSHFARVIQNLSAIGVAAQAHDFIFAARLDEESDHALVETVKKAGNVYVGAAFQLVQEKSPVSASQDSYLNQTKWRLRVEGDPGSFHAGANPLPSFPDLANASKGVGSISVKFDQDGVLRRVPLLIRFQDGFYPLLPLRAACDYLGVPPERIIVKPGEYILLEKARRPEDKEPRDIQIPIDRSGNMIVNYIGPWERMNHYSFADILKASEDSQELEMWKEELGGRIVVVSDVSTGATDIGPVPTDPNFPLSGVHATVIHNILTGSFIQEFPPWKMLALEVTFMGILFFLAQGVRSFWFFLCGIGLTAVYGLVFCGSFLFLGTILSAARPALMAASALACLALYRYAREERAKMEGLRQRDFIRETFGRYLSNEVVDELLDTPDGLKMSGEVREAAFLASDLRGFTAFCSKRDPREVIALLNRYFERMLEVIERYRGTVDELRGDGILVFFGIPLASEDDSERAVACAIEMQNALEQFNREQRRDGLPELSMGIGIHHGKAIVGNIGSEKRVKYGAVGDVINTVFRIESRAGEGQVLISPSVHEKTLDIVRHWSVQEHQLKGIGPMALYDVRGMEGKYRICLKANKLLY